MRSSKFGTVMPSGISTMPCHGVHRKENNRYRHLERSHGSLSNTKGVCNKKTANEFKCHFTNVFVISIYIGKNVFDSFLGPINNGILQPQIPATTTVQYCLL